MAHSPATSKVSRQVGLYLRNECTLDPRLRELATIQMAYSAASPYVYSHHIKIALDQGVPPTDVSAIAGESAGAPTHLDADVRLALRAAREMWAAGSIQEVTFGELQAALPAVHVVDLTFLLAFYCGFVRLTDSFGLEVEPEYAGHLAAFPLPSRERP